MAWSSSWKQGCLVTGCDLPVKGLGYCNKHYQLFKRHGKPEKLIKNDRSHPLYHLWHERKQNRILCEEWRKFKVFAEAVGERPEGNFILVRMDDTVPYGPNNFQWKEHLKKLENETDQAWWARKWKDARTRNPDVEYDRNLKRNFGISLDEYLVKFNNQNGVCAICGEPESTFGQGHTKRRLAVDHCHTADKIRDLLCSRCNKALGVVNDDIKLLTKMIAYIEKHRS